MLFKSETLPPRYAPQLLRAFHSDDLPGRVFVAEPAHDRRQDPAAPVADLVDRNRRAAGSMPTASNRLARSVGSKRICFSERRPNSWRFSESSGDRRVVGLRRLVGRAERRVRYPATDFGARLEAAATSCPGQFQPR